jgi:hypothetical protein
MWKMGLSEGGAEALFASMAGESAVGFPEIAVAEMAILGFVMGAKKIT